VEFFSSLNCGRNYYITYQRFNLRQRHTPARLMFANGLVVIIDYNKGVCYMFQNAGYVENNNRLE
jgi:hypothetical protein